MKRGGITSTIVLIVFSILLISFVYAADDTNIDAGIGNAQISSGDNDSDSAQIQSQISVGQNNEDENNELEIEEEEDEFCGTSTYGVCEVNEDCIKGGCSGQVCQSKDEESAITTCEWTECYDAIKYKARCICLENQCQWITKKELTQTQIQNITRERNRLRIHAQIEECPENCTCTGSATKCEIEGGREMTIVAGKSGNIIVQVKGLNTEGKMETNVTLYKSEGKVYGIFKDNETREVRVLPDAVKERIRERIQTRLENETIELDEDGNYKFKARKRARLFAIIPVRAKVMAEIDSETGEVIRFRKSWWGFLAKDVPEDIILGATCGTVSPDSRDECCQNRGFDLWSNETSRCEFFE